MKGAWWKGMNHHTSIELKKNGKGTHAAAFFTMNAIQFPFWLVER